MKQKRGIQIKNNHFHFAQKARKYLALQLLV